ncbi:MAG: 3-methylornithyl-N6-L-lysine dehydrogenase PylD [bacterium]
MTRLRERDIDRLGDNLLSLDGELRNVCGAGLKEIAARASGFSTVPEQNLQMGVVPVTAGLGIIGGFSLAVCSILQYLGAEAKITEATDAAGMYESLMRNEGTILADDRVYFALKHKTSRVSENGSATGRGFAAALELAAGSLSGEQVMVAGAGPVGLAAAAYLQKCGAEVIVYDIAPEKLKALPYRVTTDIRGQAFDYILEATSSADVIKAENITAKTLISAPGMPLGLAGVLAERLRQEGRLIHNPLELGTAVMYMDLLL